MTGYENQAGPPTGGVRFGPDNEHFEIYDVPPLNSLSLTTEGLDANHSDIYEWMVIEGFDVQVRLPERMDVEEIRHFTWVLYHLRKQLRRATGVLPERPVSKLRTKVRFFLKDDCSQLGEIDYWRPDEADYACISLLCFEYISGLLADAYHTGRNIDGQVVWGNPGMVIHELANAWHDLFEDKGFSNDMIEDFYDHAVACLGNEDTSDPYYWESNAREFFADFTVMYYFSRWDPPHDVWNIPRKYRIMVIHAWDENDWDNYSDQLDYC